MPSAVHPVEVLTERTTFKVCPSSALPTKRLIVMAGLNVSPIPGIPHWSAPSTTTPSPSPESELGSVLVAVRRERSRGSPSARRITVPPGITTVLVPPPVGIVIVEVPTENAEGVEFMFPEVGANFPPKISKNWRFPNSSGRPPVSVVTLGLEVAANTLKNEFWSGTGARPSRNVKLKELVEVGYVPKNPSRRSSNSLYAPGVSTMNE